MNPIYEDEHLLVFEKPSGLLSVPGRGPEKQDCLSKRVQDIYTDALVVHRLDPVSYTHLTLPTKRIV